MSLTLRDDPDPKNKSSPVATYQERHAFFADLGPESEERAVPPNWSGASPGHGHEVDYHILLAGGELAVHFNKFSSSARLCRPAALFSLKWRG